MVSIDRYLDGELSQAERHALDLRLRQDDAFRAVFAQAVRLHGQIALVVRPMERAQDFRERLRQRLPGASAEGVPAAAPSSSSRTATADQLLVAGAQGPRPSVPPSRHPRWRWPATGLLAASLLIAGVALWILLPSRTAQRQELARITALTGTGCQLSGQQAHAVEAGTLLHDQDRLTTGAQESDAALRGRHLHLPWRPRGGGDRNRRGRQALLRARARYDHRHRSPAAARSGDGLPHPAGDRLGAGHAACSWQSMR